MTLDEMLSKLAHREASMRAVIKELPKDPIIVETGCVRNAGSWEGDGQSTRIWQEVVRGSKGRVHSIDMDMNAVGVCRVFMDSDLVEVYCEDSVKFLWKWSKPIDLLYLDSLDFNQQQPWESTSHHLQELCAAMKSLRSGSIVMVDDTAIIPFGVFGKGMLIAPFMTKIGAKNIVSGPHQVAWKLV